MSDILLKVLENRVCSHFFHFLKSVLSKRTEKKKKGAGYILQF